MNFLTIQAHLDDRELSYGIVKNISALSDRVISYTACIGRYMMDKEVRSEAHRGISTELGIVDVSGGYRDCTLSEVKFTALIDEIYDTLVVYGADVILIHSEDDLHQDHKLLSQASKIAIERYSRDYHRNTKVIEVLHISMFNRGDEFLVVDLNDYTFLMKEDYCKRFTTEKLTPLRQEFFKVYSAELKKIKRHNIFTENSFKDFLRT